MLKLNNKNKLSPQAIGRNLALLTATLILTYTGFSQSKNYPQDYFQFPIKTGQANELAGSFAELRSNHFHAGLDIRTEQKVGLPVYAAADGYVARLKASTSGYGNVLYIAHPNGYTTVYGHLDVFNDKIGSYVRKAQYNRETFELELFPGKALAVKKGELIAYSGNSGSSGGPHLHFEIRDSGTQESINPLFFGFDEIEDNIPPVFKKFALTSFGIHSRVNEEFDRKEFTAVKGKNSYLPDSKKITGWGLVGLEIMAEDKHNGSSFRLGLKNIEVTVDGETVFDHQIDRISFDKQRHMNVHMNYEEYRVNQEKFERCYKADGNRLPFYHTNNFNGKILINEERDYEIRVEVCDSYDNTETLLFTIKGERPKPNQSYKKGIVSTKEIKTKEFENILKISAPLPPESLLTMVTTDGKRITQMPNYSFGKQSTYLWDLRKGLPDSIFIGKEVKTFSYAKMIPPASETRVSKGNVSILFPKNVLFDTLYLELEESTKTHTNGFEIVEIGEKTVPFFKPMHITLKIEKEVSDKSQTLVYYLSGNNLSYEGGTWNGNKITFKTRSFGSYVLAVDKRKPEITPLKIISNSISFSIKDNLSGIRSFKATLNGKFLLMNYDHKKNKIWSERLEDKTPLKGNFVLRVTDNAGNSNSYETELK